MESVDLMISRWKETGKLSDSRRKARGHACGLGKERFPNSAWPLFRTVPGRFSEQCLAAFPNSAWPLFRTAPGRFSEQRLAAFPNSAWPLFHCNRFQMDRAHPDSCRTAAPDMLVMPLPTCSARDVLYRRSQHVRPGTCCAAPPTMTRCLCSLRCYAAHVVSHLGGILPSHTCRKPTVGLLHHLQALLVSHFGMGPADQRANIRRCGGVLGWSGRAGSLPGVSHAGTDPRHPH
eukprot:366463-Chlamydomonas_euryale.AAC.11